jgi:hypothetical protein
MDENASMDVVDKSTGETPAHRQLKRLAFDWARANGLPLAGFEVRVPRSGYRADVAAMSRHPTGENGVCAVFECKQARSDFLRDETDESRARLRCAELTERVHSLRSLIGMHRPDLRRSEELFPEFEDFDLRGLRHETLEQLELELETLQEKLMHGVKFARLRRYRLANHLYLVTEPEIIESHEVPSGWGWLVRSGSTLELRLRPVRLVTDSAIRLAWLESLAVAGCRAHRVVASDSLGGS